MQKDSTPTPNVPSTGDQKQTAEAKAPAIKYDWYQTESHVCVTVLAKNLDPSQVNVEFTSSNVRDLVFFSNFNRQFIECNLFFF